MTNTTRRTQTQSRAKAIGPTIREICLVGDPSRRYVHLTPEGFGAEDMQRRSKRAIPDKM